MCVIYLLFCLIIFKVKGKKRNNEIHDWYLPNSVMSIVYECDRDVKVLVLCYILFESVRLYLEKKVHEMQVIKRKECLNGMVI